LIVIWVRWARPVQGGMKSGRKVNRVRIRVGALVDQEAEQFQRGGIDPMQVFHHNEHRLLGRNAQQDRQESVQRSLLLLLGRQGQGGILCRQWEGE
jgi:hypothetical protein